MSKDSGTITGSFASVTPQQVKAAKKAMKEALLKNVKSGFWGKDGAHEGAKAEAQAEAALTEPIPAAPGAGIQIDMGVSDADKTAIAKVEKAKAEHPPVHPDWWGVDVEAETMRRHFKATKCQHCEALIPTGMTIVVSRKPKLASHISCAMHARARTHAALGKAAKSDEFLAQAAKARAREMREMLWLRKAATPGQTCSSKLHAGGCFCAEAKWNWP